MSEFQSSNFKKENGGSPNLVGKTELTSPYFFVPPSGDTAKADLRVVQQELLDLIQILEV